MSKLRTLTILASAGLLFACVDEPLDGSSDYRLPERPDSPGVNDQGLAVCGENDHCAEDEACTQGGLCINITGERDATEILLEDLQALPEAVGNGVPYRLPENGIFRLSDLDGDGVALSIDKKINFDGAGSLFLVDRDITALEITPTAARSTFRNFRVDPLDADGAHDGVALEIKAPGVRLENLYIWRMGTGIRAAADSMATHQEGLQSQQWHQIVYDEIHHHATFIHGEGTHAGTLVGSEIINGAGHYDDSTAGNTYLGVNAENATHQSIELNDDFAASTVVALNLRGDSPAATSGSLDDFHIGGNAIIDLDGPGDRVGQQAAILHFFDHEEGLIAARIPGDADAPIQWEYLDEASQWSLRLLPDFNEWGVSVDGSPNSPFTWTAGGNGRGPAELNLFE